MSWGAGLAPDLPSGPPFAALNRLRFPASLALQVKTGPRRRRPSAKPRPAGASGAKSTK